MCSSDLDPMRDRFIHAADPSSLFLSRISRDPHIAAPGHQLRDLSDGVFRADDQHGFGHSVSYLHLRITSRTCGPAVRLEGPL